MSRPCANAEFDCDGVLGDRSENDYCSKCRQHNKRWAKRSGGDVRDRYRHVNCWTHRIAMHPKLKEEEKKRGTGAKVINFDTTRTRKRA